MIHYYLSIIHYSPLLITLWITMEKRGYNSWLIHTSLLRSRGLSISTVF